MPQLKKTCSVTNGSQTVVFPGVDLTLRIKRNHIFMVDEELVPYTVSADSTYVGGNTQVVLTGAYQGTTNASAVGVLVSDYTYPDLIPTISQGDVGTAAIYTSSMYRLQALMASVSPAGLTQYKDYYDEVAVKYGLTVTAASEAAASASAANTSKNNASTSATNAAASATLAQNWATKTSGEVTTGQGYGAKKYANDAASSATAAAGSASAAASSQTASAGSATTASTKASEASTSASTAATHAQTATTKASEAATSATNAAGSATTASGYKDSALASKNAASTSETNAAASATLAENWATKTSGEVVAGQGYSAKKHATDAAASAVLSQDWATKNSGEVVAGQGYSAKKYANDAAASAQQAADYAASISTGQVNADWNEANPASKAYILNKPTIPQTKADIGLGNVQNLAPADLPISTLTQTALNAKADISGYTTRTAALDLPAGGARYSTTRISNPGGAYLVSGSAATGAIKIKFPLSGQDTMVKMRVELFSYAANHSCSVDIAGYCTSAAVWGNQSVVINGPEGVRDLAVRFGHESSVPCIWIGELTTTWAWLSAYISDVMIKHNATTNTIDRWDDGWSMSIVTAFDTVEDSINNNLPLANTMTGLLSILNGGTGAPDAAGALTNLGAVAKAGDTLTGYLTLHADPTNAMHPATKQSSEDLINRHDYKSSVRAATTANITLSGTQTIDGVVLVAGNRVLVKNQSTGSQNGIYVVSSAAWSRSEDANTSAKVTSGLSVYVEEGATNGTNSFTLTTSGTITLGTTSLTFTQTSGAGQITAGDGLTKSGNTLNVAGTASRISVSADSVDIASDYVGQTSITTVGTVTTGTWSATAIAANKGGTGQTSYAVGDILFANTTTTLSKLAGVATGNALISGGVGAAPSWGKIGLTTHVSGTLPPANGGTGVTTSTGTGSVVLSASPTLTGAPLTPTPAQFDDTTKIANMAAINRAGWHAGIANGVNGGSTLTTAHAGKLCMLNGTIGTGIVTLPAASTFPAGLSGILALWAEQDGWTINSAGTNNIYFGSQTLTSVAMNAGDALYLQSDGSTGWVAIGGSVAMQYAAGMDSYVDGRIGDFNRIVNGDLRIDKRNEGTAQTFTAGAALAYCVDRFYGYCTGANVTGQRIAGGTSQYIYRFTGAAGVTAIGFGQRIKQANCYDLAGSNATLSVDLANSVLTTVTWTAYYANTTDTFGSLASPTKTQIATGTFTVNSTLTRYSTVIAIPSAATTGIEIVLRVGAQTSGTWTIGRVKLERGSIATPFKVRPYNIELMYCQHHYVEVEAHVRGYSSSASQSIGAPVYWPVAMHAAPTVSDSGGTLTNVDNTAIDSASVSGAFFRASPVAAGTVDVRNRKIVAVAEVA